MQRCSNDLEVIERLASVVLDVHPEVEAIRESWSVADAMAKWGVERRTKGEPAWSPDETLDPVHGRSASIPEWDNPIIGEGQKLCVSRAAT